MGARLLDFQTQTAPKPPRIAPRGLSRTDVAEYLGISPSLFDEMVRDGRMPKAIRINARTVWDRHLVDEAFDALAGKHDDVNDPWSSPRA